MHRDKAPPGKGSDTDALVLPTWRWHARDPWYGGGRQPGALRRKRAAARVGALTFGGPVDLAIIALALFFLLGLQSGSFGGLGGCEVQSSDLGFLRRSIILCEGAIKELKKQARGQFWAQWSLCGASSSSLIPYFNFTPRSSCPDTPLLAENLRFIDNCHELPRRNCFSPHSPNFEDPPGFPESRWQLPSDRNVLWNDSFCQGYKCLMDSSQSKCPGCFQLTAENKLSDFRTLFSVDSVLGLKAPGRVRIGLDVGGREGGFAATMAERGVLIMTTSENSGIPFMETIASRGLLGLHLPLSSRLPFFDGTLDLLHWKPSTHKKMPSFDEFKVLLFEWDRILRPGGLLWLDRMRSPRESLEDIKFGLKLIGYQKKMWNVSSRNPMVPRNLFVSVVLEKPVRRTKKVVKALAAMT